MQDFFKRFQSQQYETAFKQMIDDKISQLTLNSKEEKGEFVMMVAQAMANSCHNKLEELKGDQALS